MAEQPLVLNAADAVQVRNARRKEKDSRKRELHSMRVVLGTPEGRELVFRILGYTGFYDDRSMPGDPNATLFVAGQRNVGVWLMAELVAADEDKLLVMMKESRARQRSDAIEAEALRTASSTNQQGDEQ